MNEVPVMQFLESILTCFLGLTGTTSIRMGIRPHNLEKLTVKEGIFWSDYGRFFGCTSFCGELQVISPFEDLWKLN